MNQIVQPFLTLIPKMDEMIVELHVSIARELSGQLLTSFSAKQAIAVANGLKILGLVTDKIEIYRRWIFLS